MMPIRDLHNRMEGLLHDLLTVLFQYHSRAESLNPQGRKLKHANH